MSDDIVNRLRCRYASGPIINGEPEFGWRDFGGPVEKLILPTPIMKEAADEIERLRAEVAGLRERVEALEKALRGVLPWVVTQVVACNGLKCREAVCMSCDSDAEDNAQLACDAYAAADAAMTPRSKGTIDP